MTVGERIKKLRNNIGISQVSFAEQIGVSKQTLYKYENGIITNIPSDKIELVAQLCNVSPAYIMGWNYEEKQFPHPDLMPIKTKKWRVLGEIACGEPIYANEDFDSYIEAGADIPADFCVRAKGDSMINARILDGDIVFIRKQSMVENGDIAAVVVGDETTLKRFYKHGDTIHLLAENPKYEPLIYSNEELNQIYILGKAVAFQSDIK